MSILDEFDKFKKIENGVREYQELLIYTEILVTTLKHERKLNCKRNKKLINVKNRLSMCEKVLIEKGVDLDTITRSLYW